MSERLRTDLLSFVPASLQTILGLGQVLAGAGLQAEQSELCGEIVEAAEELLLQLSELEEYSRERPLVEQRRSFALAQTVTETVRRWQRFAAERGVELSWKGAALPARAAGHPEGLRRILTRLLGGSLATPEPSFEMHCAAEDSGWRVTITGPSAAVASARPLVEELHGSVGDNRVELCFSHPDSELPKPLRVGLEGVRVLVVTQDKRTGRTVTTILQKAGCRAEAVQGLEAARQASLEARLTQAPIAAYVLDLDRGDWSRSTTWLRPSSLEPAFWWWTISPSIVVLCGSTLRVTGMRWSRPKAVSKP